MNPVTNLEIELHINYDSFASLQSCYIQSVAVCVYVCERVEWEALSYIKPN